MKDARETSNRQNAGGNGNGSGGADGGSRPAARASRGGFALAEMLATRRKSDLVELHRFWSGKNEVPANEDELRRHLAGWMGDPARIEERVKALSARLSTVFESLVGAARYRKSWEELSATRGLESLSPYELEAAVVALARRGLVVEGEDQRFESFGGRVIGIPLELGDLLLQKRRERRRGIFGVLTLRGHLDQLYAEPVRSANVSPRRLRELYKLYSQETACTARIDRLPEGVRALVEKAILEFGGVLPRQFFERMDTALPHWNGRRWRMILEQSLVGTVQELDLSRYGIALQDEVLVVFNEVALAWLRRVAVPSDPDAPHEELSTGIDLASNISRFLTYLDQHGVRFTVRGDIFKTTEKRILQHLIENPGRDLSREEVLRFIFRFAKQADLIDRTGNRTFAVTAAGREWDGLPLIEKQRALLEYALEERRGAGDPLHEVGMRGLLLRLLKRVEPLTWYDLMYLPFLARNTYLSTLDDERADEELAERCSGGRIPSLEDPQRLAWNLIKWARERLHLLGLIDLGYDKSGRPVALRLTSAGARLFGVEGRPCAPRAHESLVITPDFEIVLFPTGDDGELVHALDRFATREKHGSLMHFRLSQEGIARALRTGMALAEILTLLESHSRTPVPQNVAFSIKDWGLRAGLMRLDSRLHLFCEEPEVLRRFSQDPGARRHLAEIVDERTVRLKGRVTPRRMQALLRELGYLIELGDAAL